MPKGSTQYKLAYKGAIMTNLARFHAANLPELMERIHKNSIGMDDYLNRFWDGVDSTSNYPPYNIIEINNVESRLEVALAGFKKMSSKSLRSLENYMSRAAKKNRKMLERLDIEEWPQGRSLGSGHSLMIPKYEESNSMTDYSL